MPARVQQLILGVGLSKQADIATASADFLRFKKLDATVTSPKPTFENDAVEIGKGHEFNTQTFPSHYDVSNRIEKYSCAEFAAWAWAYALGDVVETGSAAPYTYVLKPIDPAVGLELPYFSIVEQIAEGGAEAIDNLYRGCAIESLMYQFNYGPGRQSGKFTVNWNGSGLLTQPSAVTVPALVAEKNMLSATMALTISGVDYTAAATILSGSVGWANNLLLNAGFFPGSGLQNGLQVRGRMEIGPRVPTFQFTVRLLATSLEYTKLTAQTIGTVSLLVQFDADNSMHIEFPKMAFQMVENTEVDGIIAVQVTGTPIFDTVTGTVMKVTCKTSITGIAQ